MKGEVILDIRMLNANVQVLIDQIDDIQKMIEQKKLGFYAPSLFLNIKQRQRFIASTFAKNYDDAIMRLVKAELNV